MVPHYDNAEGGTHDTRFCYIGERRLRVLERALPRGAFVLGVDSHTALVLDLDDWTATVFGLGGVTIRVDGRSLTFGHGTETTIDALADAVRELRAARSGRSSAGRRTVGDGGDASDRPRAGESEPRAAGGTGPVRDEVAELEGTFVASLGGGDVRAAVGALIALDQAIERRVGRRARTAPISRPPGPPSARSSSASAMRRAARRRIRARRSSPSSTRSWSCAVALGRAVTGSPRTSSATVSSRPASTSTTSPRGRAGPSARPHRAERPLNRDRGPGARPRTPVLLLGGDELVAGPPRRHRTVEVVDGRVAGGDRRQAELLLDRAHDRGRVVDRVVDRGPGQAPADQDGRDARAGPEQVGLAGARPSSRVRAARRGPTARRTRRR